VLRATQLAKVLRAFSASAAEASILSGLERHDHAVRVTWTTVEERASCGLAFELPSDLALTLILNEILPSGEGIIVRETIRLLVSKD
jgi:hypothetical protein